MIVLNAKQIKDWDAFTMKLLAISSLELMENAAMACCQWLEANIDKLTSCYVFCGKGNNGGDGLAIARLLAEKGIEVHVFILENGKKGTDDFQSNLHRIHKTSVELHYISEADQMPTIPKSAIVLDALLGIGINRASDGLTGSIIKHINASGNRIVSIDLPSGLYPDKYSYEESIVKATDTLSFQAYKTCFLFAFSYPFTGNVIILDIGLDKSFIQTLEPEFRSLTPAWLKSIFRRRPAFSNKGNFGHALIFAGNKQMLGASMLAAKACLRSGVGKLTVGIEAEHWPALNAYLPETMLMEPLNCLQTGELSRFHAVAIGPGLGNNEQFKDLLFKLLDITNLNFILDADALNLISKRERGIVYKSQNQYILTPHPKEADRLLGVSANEFERLDKARSYCKNNRLVMILKGRYSIVIDENGHCYVNSSGNAGLAKGGTGDVLTGIVTAFLAQGYSPLQAACLSVYLHGRSADICIEQQSQESLLPSDVIEGLGRAFQELY